MPTRFGGENCRRDPMILGGFLLFLKSYGSVPACGRQGAGVRVGGNCAGETRGAGERHPKKRCKKPLKGHATECAFG